jgi:hypothetical protein
MVNRRNFVGGLLAAAGLGPLIAKLMPLSRRDHVLADNTKAVRELTFAVKNWRLTTSEGSVYYGLQGEVTVASAVTVQLQKSVDGVTWVNDTARQFTSGPETGWRGTPRPR